MENIYVPLDFSNLRDFIPPDEKIIYSSLCIIKFKYRYFVHYDPLALSSSFPVLRDKSKVEKIAYNSHLLITTRGFAYFCQPLTVIKKKPIRLPQIPTYNTLLNINNISNIKIRALHSDTFISIPYNFKLKRHPNYESEKTFRHRLKEFKLLIYPYYLESLESMLNYIQENRDKEQKDDPPLWQLDENFLIANEDKEWSNKLLEYINDLIKKGVKRKKINILEFLTQLQGKSQIAYINKAIDIKKEIVVNTFKLRNCKKSLFEKTYETNLRSRIRMVNNSLKTEEKKNQKRQEKQKL